MTWKEQIVGAFGFGTAPFALHQSDADLGKGGHPGSQADGATREVFAREIARYARKYVSSENSCTSGCAAIQRRSTGSGRFPAR